MLTCVFHPIDAMRVVEDDEAERLMNTGVWFDSPATAKCYRERVEQDIQNEPTEDKPKVKRKERLK